MSKFRPCVFLWCRCLETAKLLKLAPVKELAALKSFTEPLDLNLIPMMFSQLSVGSSPVGSPATIRKMLDFAARHNINPVTEHFSFDQVNDAMEHLHGGKARYRIVLSRD